MERLRVPEELSAYADEYKLVVLAFFLLLLYLIDRYARPRRRRRWRSDWSQKRAKQRDFYDISDPTHQMNVISKVGFETVPLLNKEEFRVYAVLEKVLSERRDGSRLMAQTSLGEILRPGPRLGTKVERDLAYRSINSKRLDFAIFDSRGHLALAIEYQGSGHYHTKSFMRDAVKREAIRKANVPFLEVPVRFDPEELSAQVRRALPRQSTSGSRA